MWCSGRLIDEQWYFVFSSWYLVMTQKIQDYADLKVWQKAMTLVVEIYRMTDEFPRKEQYRLTDQLCRSVVSVPSNIAEGSARKSTKDYIRFLNIAYASLMECETQVRIAQSLNYIDEEALLRMLQLTREIARMLNALMTSLKSKLQPTLDSTKYQLLNTKY